MKTSRSPRLCEDESPGGMPCHRVARSRRGRGGASFLLPPTSPPTHPTSTRVSKRSRPIKCPNARRAYMYAGLKGSDSALAVPGTDVELQNPIHLPTDSSGLFSGKREKAPWKLCSGRFSLVSRLLPVRQRPHSLLPRY